MSQAAQELLPLNRAEITRRCIQYCEQHFSPSLITERTDFHDDLFADPLDHIEVMDWVLDEFSISTTDDEMSAVLTVGDLVDLIERKVIP